MSNEDEFAVCEACSNDLLKVLAAHDARAQPASVPVRISEIEDAIAAGKMDAAQVFTQMRQLLPAQPASVADGWRPSDAEVKAWGERNDVADELSLRGMRTAIDDARSMHMLTDAPQPPAKESE